MGRSLRYLGLVTLTATAWLILAETVGWLPQEKADPWVWLGAKVGGTALGLGLLLGVLSPIRRELDRGRCARCGAPIERGQTYCLDHLQAAVNEYRERTRETLGSPR